MEDNKEATIENDEAALDKELEESISNVKAGNELEKTAPVKTEEKRVETPADSTVEQPSNAPGAEKKEEDGYAFRIPNKGKFESDESYEKRIELLDLVKKRKLASSPEQRDALSDQIKTAKGQLKNLGGTDKVITPLNTVEKPVPEEDEATKADRERLKQLGGATKEDVAEILREERIAIDTKSTLDKFVERHPELKDADVREVFFDFVDANYNWSGKTGKELMTVLELAQENMFRQSETIQERVLKGANVQEKVNAMQFPGGTVAKSDYSPEMRKSIDELIATGMSESKAVELLSE